MRLLILGGSGFIGRNFVQLADLSAFEVFATYNGDNTFPDFLKRVNPTFKAIRYDLLEGGPDMSGYDAAVYLAGNSNHTWALDHPDGDMMINAVGFARFLQSFHGELVLLSTGAVYFGHDGVVSPSTATAPSFPYGASKLAGELLAGWAAATNRLRSLKVLRLYYAFGPGEDERRLIRRALIQFGVRRDPKFRITGPGQSLMSPMYVSDVVRALELALKGGSPGTFDLPGDRPLTVREIVETAAEICGIEPDLEFVSSNESTLTFYSDQKAISREFGFAQSVSLEAGMKQYLEHLRIDSSG